MIVNKKRAMQTRLKTARSIFLSAMESRPLDDGLWSQAAECRRLLSSSLDWEDEIFTFDGGIYFHGNFSDHIESQAILHDMQEGDRGLIRYLKGLWEQNPRLVFVDVGANVGLYTMMASHRLPSGEVYSFEPVPDLYSRCLANITLNEMKNVQLFNVALSDCPGNTFVWVPEHKNKGMSTLFRNDPSDIPHECQVSTLDKWYSEHANNKSIGVLKVDVEGSELRVIKGGLETIVEHRPVIAMELSVEHLSRAGATIESVVQLLMAIGYRAYHVANDGRLYPAENSLWGAHQNVVFLPSQGHPWQTL